jgi:hypothetical protein
MGTWRNATREMTFVSPLRMNKLDIPQNVKIFAILGIVFFGVALIVVVGIIGMFAWCNPKNTMNKLNKH